MEGMRVPIVLGITGHRDLPPEDVPMLKMAVRDRFGRLKADYPHSPIKVFSGLAEGADRLVADVALEMGFHLVATLPMEQQDYERDFVTPQSRDEFRRLAGRSESCFAVERDAVSLRMGQAREAGYLALGRYIARHANIVIALWDGVRGTRMPDGEVRMAAGGTADVVRLCREGIDSGDPDRFQLPETTFVEHLRVRRMSSNVLDDGVGQWASGEDAEYQRRIEAMLQSIDEFNAAVGKLCPSQLAGSQGWLLGKNPPPAVMAALAQPLAVFSAADAAAGDRQAQRALAIQGVTGLAMLSIAFQQVYSGPQMRWGWLAAHIGLAMLAFALYMIMFKGGSPRERQYLDWRSLAEAMRVQVFWLASGIGCQVSEYYAFGDMGEVGWIRKAVRNAAFGVRPMGPAALAWVRDAWVKDQGDYFRKKAPENAGKAKRFGGLSIAAFSLALLGTGATLVADLGGAPVACLNLLLLASGLCFVGSAALKAYAGQMAFEEQAVRYGMMQDAYKEALGRLDECLAEDDFPRAQAVLMAIGKEALAENAGWLRLHRQRQFEFGMA